MKTITASADKVPGTEGDGLAGSTAPGHRKIFLPYQRRWLEDRSQLKIWLAARQTGKSFAISMEAVREALSDVCTNLILSSSERQSKEVMEKVNTHLRYLNARSHHRIFTTGETREEVRLPNGSRIISLPANPDTVRGFSGNVFLDEFAFHRDAAQIWRAMFPAVTRGFKIRITSTPNGKTNLFHDLWHTSKRFSKHRTDIYAAVGQGLPCDIDALREGIGSPEAWAQEYECSFLDAESAFISYALIAGCEDEGATCDTGRGFSPTPSPTPEGTLYLGVDIGRKHDLTVMWLWERVGDVHWCRMVKVMKDTPFRLQREALFALLDGTSSHGRIARCAVDASGLGAQLAEEAAGRFGPRVEPITFTTQIKEELAVTMKRMMEDRLVRLPMRREIRDDFMSVRRFTTNAGHARFDAQRNAAGHADRFWAAALGLHAASQSPWSVECEGRGTRTFNTMGGYLG